MLPLRTTLVVLALSAMPPLAFADVPVDDDLARLQGIWVAEVRSPKPGETIEVTLIFKDDTFSMIAQPSDAPEPRVITGKFRIGPSQNPKHLDLTDPKTSGNFPPPKGDLHAIYKLEGSTLTVGMPQGPDAPRPTEFPEDTGQGPPRLIVLKKQKDADSPKE